MNASTSRSLLPSVSIIIPLRNERTYIRQCLEAIAAQDYPQASLEVICVDGMSTDGTRALITQFAQQSSHKLTLLDNPAQIVPVAMNLGIRAAAGEIIVRVDARSFIAPDYVSQTVRLLQREGVAGAAGPQIAVGDTYLNQVIAIAMNSQFGMGSPYRYVQSDTFTDTIYLGSYAKTTIAAAGYFDERFVRNQDYEFNYRVRKHVGPLLCSPSIRSRYVGRATVKGLWKQYFQFGFWRTRTIWKHPESLRYRHLVAPGLVATLLSLALLGLGSKGAHKSLQVVLLSYLLANGAFSLRELKSHPSKHVMFLPVVFAIFHFSWGLGFLWGATTLACSRQERANFRRGL